MWRGALRVPRLADGPCCVVAESSALAALVAAAPSCAAPGRHPSLAARQRRRGPLVNKLRAHGAFSGAAYGSCWRPFATVPVPKSDRSTAVAPEVDTPQTLAQLSQNSGLLPRPQFEDERLKPGFRGGKALAVFFLLNALPFGGLLYYLREERGRRAEMSLLALPAQPEDVAAEAQRTIRTAATCFLLLAAPTGSSASALGPGGAGAVVRVDPHAPEGTAYVPPTEPLPLVPQMERNDITDIFESPVVAGLDYIHFALSRSSKFGAAVLAGERQASLLYTSHVRGAYCTIDGQMSVLADAESRRRYWKGPWAASFMLPAQASASSPPQPSSQPPAQASGESPPPRPPPWSHSDYLLVRFAVSEVSLGVLVEGPQSWEERRIKRLDERVMGEGGRKWARVAP